MASSVATTYCLEDDTLKGPKSTLPKQTAIEKIGGIFCHICNSTYGNKKEFDSHYAVHTSESTDIVYTCVACKKQITGYPSFRGHCYLNHVVKNKFQCEYCSKAFSKLSILNTHTNAVHEFKCASCHEKFPSKKDLETHKIVHMKLNKRGNDAPPFACLQCGAEIATVDECESHIDRHCEILYPCSMCKEAFPDRTEATDHLTKHFDETVPSAATGAPSNLSEDCSIDVLGGILCCHCDLLFANRFEIDSHFLVEHEDRPVAYGCNVCGKQYEKYNIFGDHCYLHIARNKFQCEECAQRFPRLSLLVLHMETAHGGGAGAGAGAGRPHPCGACRAAFGSRARLREHARVAHGEAAEGLHRCGCGAAFPRARELALHARSHAARRCGTCGLRFGSARGAAGHVDVHRVVRLACPLCARPYRARRALLAHAAAHFARALHACAACGRAFRARHRLAAHLRAHAQASRPHACHLCAKAFRKPHELRQHLNVHEGARPFACPLCPKTFASRPNWGKHLQRVHALDSFAVRALHRDAKPAAPAAEPEPEPEPEAVAPPRAGEEDDASDIRAIVEHIDALSAQIDSPEAAGAPPQYAAMTPVAASLFDAGGASGWFPECGPELGLVGLGAEEQALRHIDPRLTVRADDSFRMYLRELDGLGLGLEAAARGDPPLAPPPPPPPPLPAHLITKVFKYEDNNDANRMYIY